MTAHVVIACGKSKALTPGAGRTLPLATCFVRASRSLRRSRAAIGSRL